MLVGAGLVATPVSVPSQAVACSPCSCNVPWGLRPVADSTVKVPLNARFLVELTDYDPDGHKQPLSVDDVSWINVETNEAVPFKAVGTSGTAGQVWLVPDEALLPETQYRVEVSRSVPIFTQSFVTGTGEDAIAPEVGGHRIEAAVTDACGPFLGAKLVFESVDDNESAIDYDPVVELLVENGSDSVVVFADATPDDGGKSVHLVTPIGEESAKCWRALALPFGASGEPLTVTATVYDRAGNSTELAPFEVILSAQDGASCPSDQGDCSLSPAGDRASGGAGWLLFLVGGLGLLWRKRRRA